MRNESWASVFAVVLLCGVILSADPVQPCQRSKLPANISLANNLDRVLEDLCARSSTFKAQCERLAAAENLRVVVHLNNSLPSRFRRLTRIWRRGREIRADVHVPTG